MLAVTAAGCAARRVQLPADAGTPFPDFAETYRAVTSACAGVRTMTAELGLSGRAGGRGIRGRAIVGFEAPASMRLEGVAPFGPPAFVLAARDATATLLLPRDDRVVRGASGADILGALTGVALEPADVQAVLTGCVVAGAGATGGRLHQNGWASIDVADGATLYVERQGDRWVPRAGRRPGWQIEYTAWSGNFPETVRLTSVGGSAQVDLTATVSQLETNMPIDPAAFVVTVPPDTRELTLDELRQAGPLRAP